MERNSVVIGRNAVGVCGNAIRSGRDAILFGSGLAVGGNSFDLDAELALKLKELRALFPQEKCGSDAAFTCTAGAADAMDEILGDVRQVIIDDVRDVLDVDAASGNISGH